MKSIIITGASSGLGFETAGKLAKDKNNRLILACRNLQKAESARSKIISDTGNEEVTVLVLDTSSLSSVRAFARQYRDVFGTADVLINNAGISSQHSGTTEDGFELVFATNHLGHFLMTNLLLPYMSEMGRIITVSSDMHEPPGGIEWKGVEYIAHPDKDDRKRYSYSKLCNLYFTYKLHDILQEQGSKITANAFNPGFMATTNFAGGHMDKTRALVVKTTMPDRFGDLEKSSDALAQIAVSEQYADISGKYFDRSTNTKETSALSYDTSNREELWRKSLEYCGLTES